MLPRRKFFVTAGLVTGGAVTVPLSPLAFAQKQQPANDPVADELLAQMDRNLEALAKQPRGEHLRGFAAALRVLAAHEAASGMDAQFRAALRRKVQREGANATVLQEPNWPEVEGVARKYGVTITRAPLDFEARQRVLAAVQTGGLAAEWRRVAGLLDQMATDFDARGLVAFRRQDRCYFIRQQLDWLGWLAAVACLSSCGPCCFAATLTYIAWAATVQASGC